jgi:hypothetical protein
MWLLYVKKPYTKVCALFLHRGKGGLGTLTEQKMKNDLLKTLGTSGTSLVHFTLRHNEEYFTKTKGTKVPRKKHFFPRGVFFYLKIFSPLEGGVYCVKTLVLLVPWYHQISFTIFCVNVPERYQGTRIFSVLSPC